MLNNIIYLGPIIAILSGFIFVNILKNGFNIHKIMDWIKSIPLALTVIIFVIDLYEAFVNI